MAVGRADAVRSGVAAADDDDMLAGGHDLVRHGIAGDDLVLLRQELHREVHAGEVAARHVEVARRFGAAGQHDRVELVQQLLRRDVAADMRIRPELDAFERHLRHAPVDQMLLHLEVGNAVAQQAADAIGLFEQHDIVAGARELLRAGHAGGPGPDDGDPAPRLGLRAAAAPPSPLPSPCR